MFPSKVYHSELQGEIAALLRLHRNDGKILTQCAVQTPQGTKAADVAWASVGDVQRYFPTARTASSMEPSSWLRL